MGGYADFIEHPRLRRDETRPYEVRRHSRARLKTSHYRLKGVVVRPFKACPGKSRGSCHYTPATEHGDVRILVVAGFIPASVGLSGVVQDYP